MSGALRTAVGWPLLPVPGPDGRITWPDGAASVRQAIEAILRTVPGERLMRPAHGAGLERLVHQPNTLATRAQAQEAVTAALRLYEPRILLDRVDVAEGPGATAITVTVAYRLLPGGEAASVSARVAVGAA